MTLERNVKDNTVNNYDKNLFIKIKIAVKVGPYYSDDIINSFEFSV